MIKLENISKSYGDRAVLTDFSLSADIGERICLVGASGCGKTTLLHIIAGLEMADGGNIRVSDAVAIMFQEPRLLPWKSAIENIAAVLPKNTRVPAIELVKRHLSAVGLAAEAEKMPDSLSGGMAQRVALARFFAFADVTGAQLLLLDEPFSALDKATADDMLSLLDKFSEGKTLVLVAHDESHAEKLGARIVEL